MQEREPAGLRRRRARVRPRWTNMERCVRSIVTGMDRRVRSFVTGMERRVRYIVDWYGAAYPLHCDESPRRTTDPSPGASPRPPARLCRRLRAAPNRTAASWKQTTPVAYGSKGIASGVFSSPVRFIAAFRKEHQTPGRTPERTKVNALVAKAEAATRGSG